MRLERLRGAMRMPQPQRIRTSSSQLARLLLAYVERNDICRPAGAGAFMDMGLSGGRRKCGLTDEDVKLSFEPESSSLGLEL